MKARVIWDGWQNAYELLVWEDGHWASWGFYEKYSKAMRELHKVRKLNSNPAVTMADLKNHLAQATGSEVFYSGKPLFPRFVYTQGIKAMADMAGAYWLIDLIFSHQITPRVRLEPFQIWTVTARRTKRGLGRGMAEMKTDTNQPVLARQRFSTDFPEGEFKLYFIDGVLLLPSEY